MKAAFATWDNRIAPVFDVALQILVVEANGPVVRETEELFADNLPVHKALRLAELGVGILICGAISKALQETIAANGIRVIPFVVGDLREIIRAWLTGGLERDAFAMPGCCGRDRFKTSVGTRQEEQIMKGRNGTEQTGWDQDLNSQRFGRMRSRLGSRHYCVCPECGQKERHKPGMPCFEQKCPKCGATMTGE